MGYTLSDWVLSAILIIRKIALFENTSKILIGPIKWILYLLKHTLSDQSGSLSSR